MAKPKPLPRYSKKIFRASPRSLAAHTEQANGVVRSKL